MNSSLTHKFRYLNYQDIARLEYGRLLWRNIRAKKRLLDHWNDPRHPYSDRFKESYHSFVERLLSSDPLEDESLDEEFIKKGQSLRTIIREIPPIFGSFF